jgi:hypothetical protein
MTLRGVPTSSTPRWIPDPPLATSVRAFAAPGSTPLRLPDPPSLGIVARPLAADAALRTHAIPPGGVPAFPPVATAGHRGARFKSLSEPRASSS